MAELKIRRRHRLRQKEIQSLFSTIETTMGTKTVSDKATVDRAEAPDFDVLFVDNSLLAIVIKGEPFLTVRGVLKYGAAKRHVTVDMGAVKFVANGADVMGPGIVDVDDSISEGDLVWVRDERNLRPLAIGRAAMPGLEMRTKPKGKSVLSIHHVGDRLWMTEEEGQR
ncbi:MAG: RNA-binding protein [Thermoplasmata archaeon]|nr:RNA-binding protein [Thermoplasmata archaeon]